MSMHVFMLAIAIGACTLQLYIYYIVVNHYIYSSQSLYIVVNHYI